MEIIDFLKNNHNARLTVGHKWLVWTDDSLSWCVYKQQWHKQVKMLYCADDLNEALEILTQDEEAR